MGIAEPVNYSVSDYAGSLSFIAPAGKKAYVSISGHDAITGESFYTFSWITLEPNPDFTVTFAFDKEEYYQLDPITVTYSIDGLSTPLRNSRTWWGNNKMSYQLIECEEITSGIGSSTYTPPYGESIVFCLQGEDENGNLIYAQSNIIRIKAIPDELIQHLPGSLERIENEAFSGTTFIAIDVPSSVVYIAENAFADSNVRMIICHNDYVKQYASDN